MKLDNINNDLLKTLNNLNSIPDTPINLRINGEAVVRNSSSNVNISTRQDNNGLLIEVKEGSQNETVHVPVILSKPGFQDKVYNTFIVGEDADVTIVAGCGIHNAGHQDSRHDGVHEIIVKRGARLKYVEKHYGEGSGEGKRILNPATVITIEKGASAELEMVQIKGVDDTVRSTVAHIHEKGHLKIIERLLTQGSQSAESDVQIFIEGKDGSAQILSRSVAQEESYQLFHASLVGKSACVGHVECDSIIMNNARIKSIPELMAEDSEAILTHEAAIGKVAGEQLIKLMSLGLTEQEAMDTILSGFLR